MQIRYKYFLLLACLLFSQLSFGQKFWVGEATGFWDDGTNWSDGLEPTTADDVVIPGGVTVTIRRTGEVAQSVTFDDGDNGLNITAGDLTINRPLATQRKGGVNFLKSGRISISENARLDITSESSGIRVDTTTATIINAGTINFSGIGKDAIRLTLGDLTLTNQAGGKITSTGTITNNFFTMDGPSNAIISNSGTIKVDTTGKDGFFLIGNRATFTNQATGQIMITKIEDDGFNIINGATLENFGTITAMNIENQGFDINVSSSVTNHASGIITITDVRDDEAIDISGSFNNEGIINITDVQLMGVGDAAIHVEEMGTLTNSNLINVGLGTNRDTIFEVDANGTFNNSTCAVLNLTTPDPISNEGTINNEGSFTTEFTGTNTNFGTFNNSGTLSEPNGVFPLTPNALMGNMPTSSPIPAAPIMITGRDTTICSGDMIDLSVLITGTPQNMLEYGTTYGTYGLNNTQSPTMMTTYFVRDSNNMTRCVDTAMITVEVNALPTAELTSSDADNTICAGENVTFTASGGNNYQFFLNNNLVQNNTITTYSNSTLANGDKVKVTVTDANGCTDTSADITTTVNPPPTVADAGADQTLCNNSTFTLAGNTPSVGTGMWTVVSGTANITDPSSPTTTVTGITSSNSATLRWTITNSDCSPSTDDVVLTNDAVPTTADAGVDQTQCDNSTFTLAGNTPTVGTGMWTVVNGTATITSPNSPTSSVTGISAGNTATLRWTITNGTCPNSTDDVVLTNDALPTTANAGIDQNQCNNSSFTLAGNTPTVGTGTWTVINGTATITNPNSPTSTVTGITAGNAATLRWTITNGTCPNSTDDVVLRNDALPTTANAGPDQTKCNNSTFTMTANTPSVGTGTWSVFSGNATIITPNSPTTNVTVAAGNAATLRWTITNGTCPNSTDDVVLKNDALATTANAGPDQAQPNSGNFTLAGNTPTVGTGMWSVVSGTANIANPNSPTTTVTGVPAGTAATLRWTITNGTCTSSDDVNLVNDANGTTAAAGADQTQCNNGNFMMSANQPTVGSGMWSVVSGTAIITNPNSNTTTVMGIPAGTSATLRWTITNGTSVNSDEVVLTNEALPSTANAGLDQGQCGNGTFTLAGNNPTVGKGVWTVVNGTATITNPNSNTTTVTGVPAGTTATFQWTITNGTCSPSMDIVQLTNNPSPTTAQAGADQLNVCGTTVQLAANAPTTGTGQWTANPSGGQFTNSNQPNTQFQGVIGVTYTLTWTISTPTCGNSTDQLFVQFNGDTDGDTVQDCNDFCPNGDDRINTDGQGIADACDCDPDDATDEFVNVPGLFFIDSVITPGAYQSSFEITSYGKVNGGSTVILKAGKSITLTAGFFARPSSEFSAIIELCRTPGAIVETEIAAQSRTKPTTKVTELDWWVGPNPFEETFTINCQFPKDMEKVSLWVYDNMGKLVKTVLLEEAISGGMFQTTLTDNSIPAGINYVVLKTEQQMEVKKVIRVE